MRRHSVEAIARSLSAAQVRYLIAGGLAVVAHGYLRFTADVDLILDLDVGNTRRALTALAKLGYRPRAPVAMEEFADPCARRQWVTEKGMTVFSLCSEAYPDTEIDLFVEPPLDFGLAYRRAVRLHVGAGVAATFVGYDDLVELKRRAGRPQDRVDLDHLREIKDANES